MWGAIIGDLAGSIYEFDQTKQVHPVFLKTLFHDHSFYSDDTILTIAILDAILHNQNYEYYLKKYIHLFHNYKPNFDPYFKTPFSPGLIKWANGTKEGNSSGNGAMMRISPIGFLFDKEQDIIRQANLATTPSHNTEEATSCATMIAMIIFFARKHFSKQEIMKKLQLNPTYIPFSSFNFTCSQTIWNCLYALFTSQSFEEAVKKVISYGGDTDTNAAIVGSMAEAMFGIDDELIKKAKQKLPTEFVKILDYGYSKVKKF